ncbi:hypothetical protein MXB_4783, partial [Myxobolus squamalis]
MNIVYGKLDGFSNSAKNFINDWYSLVTPDNLHICDGTQEEKKMLIAKLLENNTLVKLNKYYECYLARTNPLDVARVANKTFMCTSNKKSSMTIGQDGCKEAIGQWADKNETRITLQKYFKGCMKGRTMYVLPYCMGALGSPIAKTGIEITDSAYVVVSMGIMTTMGDCVLPYLTEIFVKSVHSVGLPLPLNATATEIDISWPCNPKQTLITQFPDTNEIISFGSGYGGNSLLGKKCFALRIASNIAKKEGWLAEHMLIMGLESPEHQKIYIAAAFPSACGKTNLAMMTPSLPGWKVTCVGDDIAWMKFDKEGNLRAINPENGFFGVCPGTNHKSNPVAMEIVNNNTIFTNVCETSEGGVFWEGLEDETDLKNLEFIDWQNKKWNPFGNTKSSHPNSRFCSPLTNCPILDEKWDDPEGVPISAIVFGGRRPKGVPLVYQSFDWAHGILVGASVKSETTSAASDDKPNTLVHDPFAMRPFFGYNCGDYMQHWLDVGKIPNRKLPLIFNVNWFLKDDNANYLWPGYGENSRVLKWIHERCQGKSNFLETTIGNVPKKEFFDVTGLENLNIDKLFEVDHKFWKNELNETRNFFKTVIYKEFPVELDQILKKMEED